jgi:hypothetical protein
MGVSHGSRYLRYECRRAQMDYDTPQCQAFPVAHLDRAAGALFLEAVRPAALETTLAALAALDLPPDPLATLHSGWRRALEPLTVSVSRSGPRRASARRR